MNKSPVWAFRVRNRYLLSWIIGVLVLAGCSKPEGVGAGSGKASAGSSAGAAPTQANGSASAVATAGFPSRDLSHAPQKPMLPGLKQPVIVLCYHDIIPQRTAASLWFDCSVKEFNDQLDALTRSGCHFISIQQLYGYLTQGGSLPSHSVAITFADGYEGFYRYAIPILKKRGIPVAQFVHTGFVGSSIGRPKMTWSQLEELDQLPWVTIGSQTVTHPLDLRLIQGSALRKEMVDSREALEDHLHHAVRWLAYPNGKFDQSSEAAAKKAGYLMAFCEHQEPANVSPSIYAVNRYVDTQWQVALDQLLGR